MSRSRENRGLSRRERQILEALFELEEASVREVRELLPDPPSDTAVRTFLGLLAERGLVRRRRVGRRNLYRPAESRARAGKSALARVLDVFYQGSLTDALAAQLSDPRRRPDEAEYARLARLVRDARKRGRS